MQIRDIPRMSQIRGHILVKSAKLRVYTTDFQVRNIGIFLYATMHIILRKTVDFISKKETRGPLNGGYEVWSVKLEIPRD